jgi:hypothetical protein
MEETGLMCWERAKGDWGINKLWFSSHHCWTDIFLCCQLASSSPIHRLVFSVSRAIQNSENCLISSI